MKFLIYCMALVIAVGTIQAEDDAYSSAPFVCDGAAIAFVCPRSMALRWTWHPVFVRVANQGTEAGSFQVMVEIFEGDEKVYSYDDDIYLPPDSTIDIEYPTWEAEEFGTEYTKKLIVFNDEDQNPANDTLIENCVVECNDTIGYLWDFQNSSETSTVTYGDHLGTFYGIADGLLVTGGRVYVSDISGINTSVRLKVWESDDGCGQPDVSGPIAYGDASYPQVGWNYVVFGGFGCWVSSAEPGGIWAAITTPLASENTGRIAGFDQQVYADDLPCYQGPGPGRSATWNWEPGQDVSGFNWGAPYGNQYTIPVELFAHLAFGDFPLNPDPLYPIYDFAHDLNAYRFEQPDIEYVEAGEPISPIIGITNVGRGEEPTDGCFPVKFFAVKEDNGDTVFSESVQIEHIGWLGDSNDDPDSLQVEFPEWVPESGCEDWLADVGVAYELIGLVQLGEVGPDQSDHCPYNDTTRLFVNCLLSHDVGVTELVDANGNNWGNAPPPAGTEFDFLATVENFGFNEEHDIPVDLEIYDMDANPDSLLWHNTQEIEFLDWRGNDLENPYVVKIEFPTWTTTSEKRLYLRCYTMLDDDCPDNDETIIRPHEDYVEEKLESLQYELNVEPFDHVYQINFCVPQPGKVSINVFSISGRKVRNLSKNRYDTGHHQCIWDKSDDKGLRIPAGIYLIKMQAGKFDKTIKTVIID